MVGPTTPLVTLYCVPRLLVYFTESAKYASSAVIRLRRSDFIDARYAFSCVFGNVGIAIAAKMPMITTTIRSSISVKPLRFIWNYLPYEVQRIRERKRGAQGKIIILDEGRKERRENRV